MLFGIGTDIVRVARMAQLWGRYGDRFTHRILAESELAEFIGAAHPARFLAKRFAAKEAFVKALGTGFRAGLGLRHISVGHDSLGRPLVICTGKAHELLEQFAITASHLTISDEDDYAVAFVVLEQCG